MKLTAALVTTALLSVQALAQEDGIRRAPISKESQFNMRLLEVSSVSLGSSSSCLVVENICYQKVKDFTPLKIRTQGKWNEDAGVSPILQTLNSIDKVQGSDSLPIIQDSLDFSIRSLAMDENQSFVAEVQFSYGPAQQTIYVFGDFRPTANGRLIADVSRYSELNESQRQKRIEYKRLDNFFNSGRNFQAEIGQVGMEDVKRAQAVGNLVAAWVSATGASVAVKSTELTTAEAVKR